MIQVKTKTGSYPIYLEKGALDRAGELFNLDRRVLVLTDSGVPKAYAEKVLSFCKKGALFTVQEGEGAKSFPVYQEILSFLVEKEFDRHDCIVAVGGGVVGDLAGFVASSYMRGIDFYNVPTTVLSQVDSSIGGKVAINFEGYKNLVGAFYPPMAVLIDPNVLQTLSPRLISCGLAEAVKMAACFDKDLFERFETEKLDEHFESLLEGALLIKRRVVEEDEKENGLRKVLNFGHTLAHAIEKENGLETLYHGECVALGMLPMCSENVRERLKKVLQKFALPTEWDWQVEKVIADIQHDKKKIGDQITIIFVPEIGRFEMQTVSFAELRTRLERNRGK